ncbi:DNA replication/repair protein RecF [Mesonia sp. K7]|uniref:DNA replication/repair protein RecF n=1 Tax=Mesonia sp. K7 TaxID=2218606 RepID=UPI000DA92343|nr:DNA replication and repair protein RecF [Mesonia sp. K7]PZD78292.1 DNA replication and repair protein RecF [Mesonia sp. K7]
MVLKNLHLINYKNFQNTEFQFNKNINCFVGLNGVGKTNVLDSIYHLANGKSYFNPITSQNIHHKADFFLIDGEFDITERSEKVTVSAKKGQKKILKRNNKAYEKFSEHIGLIPVVIISPSDRDLIVEGSDVRRKFIDSIIAQNDKTFLETLIKYNKILGQRNSLLKYFASNQTFDSTTLEVYNEQLQPYSDMIYQKRKAFLEEFIPFFQQKYEAISNGKEKVSITYKSQLHEDSFLDLLEENLKKDLQYTYTTCGIHKDDLRFKINGYPVKKYGSQGQQKTFLIALKLAQYDFIKAQKGLNPILLLDDIFDKLDEERVGFIIKLVTQDNLGQLFISDTHENRTENVVQQYADDYQIITLS